MAWLGVYMSRRIERLVNLLLADPVEQKRANVTLPTGAARLDATVLALQTCTAKSINYTNTDDMTIQKCRVSFLYLRSLIQYLQGIYVNFFLLRIFSFSFVLMRKVSKVALQTPIERHSG